jgi:hypothetical protein
MENSSRRFQLGLPAILTFGLFFGFCIALFNTLPPKSDRSYRDANDERQGHDENPRARAEWELERLRDPNTGLIPNDIRRKELAFASQLDHTALFKGDLRAQSLTWNQRGPRNIGGRTRAVAFDITNDQVIMAGSVAGGLWRSEDQGASWRKISTPNELQNVTTIVQDRRPGHTNVWYYGTGEDDGSSFNGTQYTGDGVYKSIDGGLTWKQLASTASGTPQIHDQMFDFVFRLVSDSSQKDKDVLYAAATKGILRSSDGGQSWKVVLGSFDLLSSAQYSDVAVTADGVVYAAISSGSTQWSGLWRSVDGLNWTRIDATQVAAGSSSYGRIVIGLAPSNRHIAYFFIDDANTSSLLKYQYLSGDGTGSGGSWARRDANLPPIQIASSLGGLNSQVGYCMSLAVHPSDENIVFIGGTNLYRSTDGFATKTKIAWIGGYNPNPPAEQYLHIQYGYPHHHPDVQSLAFSPKNPNVMLSGTDGGVAITQDDRADPLVWSSLNHGYLTAEFFGLAIDHGTPGDALVMGGMQDNGTSATNTTDASAAWTEMRGDDGGYCAIGDHHGAFYVSRQNGNVYRGQVDQNLNATGWAFVSPDASGFLFITPWVLDPNHNERMYMTVDQDVWRETDLTRVQSGATARDPNWEDLSNTNTGAGHLTAIAVSTQPANVLYYGTNDGRVFRLDSANTTQNTSLEVTGQNFPAGYVARIAIDPHDAKKVLIVFSNYNIPSVFYTTNGGGSWKDVSGSLEQFPDGHGNGPSCRGACIVHRGSNTQFYIGTTIGLFSTGSLDGGFVQWQHESPDLIGTEIVEMIDARESDGYIAVATYGEGIFTTNLPLAVGSNAISSTTLVTLHDSYPNPARSEITLGFALARSARVSVTVFDLVGRTVAQVIDRAYIAGNHSMSIDTHNFPNGSYRYQLTADDRVSDGGFQIER